MSYGKLIVERELTKDEARQIEQAVDRGLDISFDGWDIGVTDIEVATVGHNIQHITIKGVA